MSILINCVNRVVFKTTISKIPNAQTSIYEHIFIYFNRVLISQVKNNMTDKKIEGIVSVTGRKAKNPENRIRITKEVKEALNIKTGDKLHYEVKGEKLILTKI